MPIKHFNKKFSTIVSEANKNIFSWDLEKIIEMTYTYEKINNWFLFNITLFESFLNYKNKKNIDFLFLKKEFDIKSNQKLEYIKNILSDLKFVTKISNADKVKKTILIWSLNYVSDILNLCRNWFVFELEKAWFIHHFSNEKINNLVTKNELIEKRIFWDFVSDVNHEFSYWYNFIKKHHEKKSNLLVLEDKEKMDIYLNKLCLFKKWRILESKTYHKKFLKWDFMKKKIHRKDYSEIFDMICDFYELPQRTKFTKAGSIYDWETFLEIPLDEKHEYLPVSRVLKLISHEIESHYINSYNSKTLLWNFRWAKNLAKEEWLAKFMEKIFIWYDLENIGDLSESFFVLLAWEILSWNEFKDFLKIISKEYKLKTSYIKIFIRAKRNYSINVKWVQHKDTTYFRWLECTIKYLLDWGDFRKLFLWKVSFGDLDKLFGLYINWNKKIILPVFFSDIIYYNLSSKSKDEHFKFEVNNFYLYLKKKYWFLDLDCFEIKKHIISKEKKIKKIISYFEDKILN